MSKITITAKVGPGVTATATVLNNVTSFSLDCDNEVLMVNQGGVRTQYDIGAATTITCTVSGNNYTVSIS